MGAGDILHTIYPFSEGFKSCGREKGRVDEGIGGTSGGNFEVQLSVVLD
jgi:hypothetical protein